MPPTALRLPDSRVFGADTAYEVPFRFIIPHRLSTAGCPLGCSSEAAREQHLRTPPTVGSMNMDDLASELSKIKYTIEARVFKSSPTGKRNTLMESCHEIRVLPFRTEDAPLDVTTKDTIYCLQQTKTIRKGVLLGKIGHLCASAAPPPAIALMPSGLGSSTSKLSVAFEFAPTSQGVLPPQIDYISAKLEVRTYHSLVHIESMPNLGGRQSNLLRMYCITQKLSSGPLKSLAWEHHQSTNSHPKPSNSSCNDGTNLEEDAGEAQSHERNNNLSLPIYTANYDFDLTLPSSNKKTFLPTFHSCLISRTYVIKVAIGVGIQNMVFSLAIPLQISVGPSNELGGNELPSYATIGLETSHDSIEDSALPPYR